MAGSAEEALAKMGISMDEALEFNHRMRETRTRGDRRVCVCGHGITRHRDVAGRYFQCEVGKHLCDCQHPEPVLEVQDTRMFLFKTEGTGARHALSRGIAYSVEKGKTVTWLVEPFCQKCLMEDGRKVSPVRVEKHRDVFLCDECRVGF